MGRFLTRVGERRRMVRAIADAVGRRLREDRVDLYAAEATLYLLLSALPFLVVLLSLGRTLAPLSAEGILSSVRELLPEPGAELLDAVADQLLITSRLPLLSLTVLLSVWSASRGTLSVIRGLETVFGCGDGRPFWRERGRSIALTVALTAMLLCTLLVGVFGQMIAEQIKSRFPRLIHISSWVILSRGAVLLVLLIFLFAAVCKAAAKGTELGDLPFRAHLPGAALAAGGWIVFSWGYSLFLTNFPVASALYGSLAAVVLMILWLRILMKLLLLGAEVTKLRALSTRRRKSAASR